MGNTGFWHSVSQLVKTSDIVIDRHSGTPHPHYPDTYYPFDYGYLTNTTTTDGEGIDVWVCTANEQRVNAVIATIDIDKRDAELKLLLGCDVNQTAEILAFHNTGSQVGVLLTNREIAKTGDRQ